MRRFAVAAAFLIAAAQDDPSPVFPGARGFGIHTPAGRGGKTLHVTHLGADGPGSLRDALEAEGPRTVVFDVGGVIDLGRKSLSIGKPFITVDGESAPPPGITIIRGGLTIATHDVLVRHLRVRPGDAGRPKKSGWEPDGITTAGARNVVIDHCSTSWAVDENLSVSGKRTDDPAETSSAVTVSHCIIAEGLDDSSHAKGPHSKGSLVHDGCRDIAFIGNLFAHNMDRNPYFKAHTTGVIVNNVIYNPGRRAINVNWSPGEWKDLGKTPKNCRISVVGNVMIHGADTKEGLELVSGGRGDVFLEDNIVLLRDGAPGKPYGPGTTLLKEKPSWPPGLQALPSDRVLDDILENAGARPDDRDAVDRRILRDLRDRKGRIIDSQEEAGGYPK